MEGGSASYPVLVFEFLNVNELSIKQMAFVENIEAVSSKILILCELGMALSVGFEPTTNGFRKQLLYPTELREHGGDGSLGQAENSLGFRRTLGQDFPMFPCQGIKMGKKD